MVECAVPGINAALEIGNCLPLLLSKARGDPVILGQIEIDDLDRSWRTPISFWRTLHQPARHIPRLGQEKQADLRDVSTCRDVDEVVFRFRIERVLAREFEKSLVDFLKIPRVVELHLVLADFRFRRNSSHVSTHCFCQGRVALPMQQFKATHNKVWLSAERNGRAPILPPIGVFAHVEGSAKQADHDNTALSLIHWNMILSYNINTRISKQEPFRATLDTSATCRKALYGPALAFLVRKENQNVRRILQRYPRRAGCSDQGVD